MKTTKIIIALFFFAFMTTPLLSMAQSDDLYDEGSVWNLTFIKLKPNVGDVYLKGLNKTWRASMDEMVKEKLIKSYKILRGNATNSEDFDLLLMMEFEKYGDFDSNPEREAKIKAIEKKIQDQMGEEYKKTIENYASVREITGNKVMREIHMK